MENQPRDHRIPSAVSLFLLFLVLLLSVQPVAAHGDGAVLRLAGAPAGPFTLNVWTYPGYLVPGTVHFSVAVLEAASGSPLPATAVFIQATPLEEENSTTQISSRATLEYQTLLHEGYLDMQEPGRYQVTVQVAASTEQQGQVTFEIEIVSGTGFKLMIILFMGATGIIAIWFAREGLRTWGIERLVKRLRK